ncbi:hypothetical protein ACFYZH_21165 [Streptomyces abikoensis]|uniref:hypothetical protein n=1 Tax=Streptomyces abikoensis TaxID=97398 RepID=UPI0036CD2914
MSQLSSRFVGWLRKLLSLELEPPAAPTPRPLPPSPNPTSHSRQPVPLAYRPVPFRGRDGGEYALIATVHGLDIVPRQRSRSEVDR